MTDPGWQMVEYGRHFLRANGHELQVVRNPDREDQDRALVVVNRRPIGKARTVPEAKRKALNFIFGVERKPHGAEWDWSQVRPVEEVEKDLATVPPIAIPGEGPQPDLAGAPQPDLAPAYRDAPEADRQSNPQPDPQPDRQPAPPLTLSDADAILDAHYEDVPPAAAPSRALAVPDVQIAPLGSELEVRLDLKAVFRSSDPEAVIAQVRTYIELMRAELGGDVDCKVTQPPVFRL